MCDGESIADEHTVAEMMFGTGARFAYLECRACGSLTLRDVPPALDAYYPADYYSLLDAEAPTDGALGRSLRRSLMRLTLANAAVGELVLSPPVLGKRVPPWARLLPGLGLRLDAAVLDAGCGNGHRLLTLQRHGFRNLTGADPHLPEGLIDDGVRFWRGAPQELTGPFDLVMFHHSFEHMEGPTEVLVAVRRMLAPGGAVILRLPLAGSYAWRRYGVHWVQLDAPRHLFVPTVAGVHLLAADTGFSVAKIVFDSDGFQFWGSEQYRDGIPLYPPGAHAREPTPTASPARLRQFQQRAAELNAVGDGDQAAFLLRKTQDAAGSGNPA